MKRVGLAAMLLISLSATGMAQKQAKPAPKESTADQRAPKGMCRIWLKDVSAAQQPAPTDCATAVKNCPPNGRVIFGDADDSKKVPVADTTKQTVDKKSPLVKSLVGDGKKATPPIVPRKPPE